jgi:hypothetical protein
MRYAVTRRALRFACLLLAILVAAPGAATSQTPEKQETPEATPEPAPESTPEPAKTPPPLVRPRDDSGILTLQFDNDMFGGTDRHFTHGMRASWLSPEGGAPDFVRDLARKFPTFTAADRMRVSYTIGQNIFTPGNIVTTDPPAEDRPYAGWAYFGVGLVAEQDRILDKIELDVGIVGPYSFAEDVQTGWHELIGIDVANGWDTQLKTEPGVVLYFERTWRELRKLPIDHIIPFGDLSIDLSPHLGGALGNVFTYGAGGLTARLGDDLPNDYGPPKIRPSLPGSDFFHPEDRIACYIFGGIEARLVARNIFIDGNTFRSSRSAERVPIVIEFQTGFAFTFDRVRIAYIQVFRSKEFKGQSGFDNFGSAALSIRF